jgi:apolipoprotein N-acyltransferase
MGISAAIDPDGRVIALPADTWMNSKNTAGIVRCEVPIDDRYSVYAAAGDWLPGFCWAVLGVSLILGIVRRKPRTQPDPATP